MSFTADPSSAGVCTVSGATVSFVGSGTCTIDANQAGNGSYQAAPQVQQSFAVGRATQTITLHLDAARRRHGRRPDVLRLRLGKLRPRRHAHDRTRQRRCLQHLGLDRLLQRSRHLHGECEPGRERRLSGRAAGAAVVHRDESSPVEERPVDHLHLDAPGGAVVGGSTYTVKATASSGLVVSFSLAAGSAGVCSLAGSTVSFVGAGTCTINANQAGNANYFAAPQVQQSFTVALRTQSISFTSSPPGAAVVGGSTYTVAATATSGLAVSFSAAPASAGVCTVAGSTVTMTGAGTCTVDANQAGNGTYQAAPQAQQSFTVNRGPQTITFTSTPPAADKNDPPYTVTATVDLRARRRLHDRSVERRRLLRLRLHGQLLGARHLHRLRESARKRELPARASGPAGVPDQEPHAGLISHPPGGRLRQVRRRCSSHPSV